MGCARAKEQTTEKNVVLTFKLVDEIHETVVSQFWKCRDVILRAITQMEPAKYRNVFVRMFIISQGEII